MKNIGTITIAGQAHQLQEAYYPNGLTAIVIDEGRWGKLTVNVVDVPPPPPGHVYVKTWEENARVRAPALATGLFRDTGARVPCGFAMAELWSYAPPVQSNDRQASQGNDKLRKALRDALSAALGDAMDCTRVWEAWNVGTMSKDDFELLADNDERLDELVDAVLEQLPAHQPVQDQAEPCLKLLRVGAPGSSAETISVFAVGPLPPNGTLLYAAAPPPEVSGHAPRGWWVGEMRAIFSAAQGDPITADMKRAANIVLKIVNGEKFDSNRAEWIMPGEEVPKACDPATYEGGAVVAIMDGGMQAMEGLVAEANRRAPGMDWHYFGGRAVVKTLGDVEPARLALERALPVFLDRPAAPTNLAARVPPATEFDHSEGGHHD